MDMIAVAGTVVGTVRGDTCGVLLSEHAASPLKLGVDQVELLLPAAVQ